MSELTGNASTRDGGVGLIERRNTTFAPDHCREL